MTNCLERIWEECEHEYLNFWKLMQRASGSPENQACTWLRCKTFDVEELRIMVVWYKLSCHCDFPEQGKQTAGLMSEIVEPSDDAGKFKNSCLVSEVVCGKYEDVGQRGQRGGSASSLEQHTHLPHSSTYHVSSVTSWYLIALMRISA